MPFPILAPIVVLSIVGGYATRDMRDTRLMPGFGFGASFLRRFDHPLAPAIFAIVLGPIAGPTLRRSLLPSSGDPMIFPTRPIAGPIAIVAPILILRSLLEMIRARSRQDRQAPAEWQPRRPAFAARQPRDPGRP